MYNYSKYVNLSGKYGNNNLICGFLHEQFWNMHIKPQKMTDCCQKKSWEMFPTFQGGIKY